MLKLVVQVTQITLSTLLITLVLIQTKGVGLSGTFGGGGEIYFTRRGAEKFIFILTIAVILAFIGTSILNVWLS